MPEGYLKLLYKSIYTEHGMPSKGDRMATELGQIINSLDTVRIWADAAKDNLQEIKKEELISMAGILSSCMARLEDFQKRNAA